MLGKLIRRARTLIESPIADRYDDEMVTRFRIARKALGGKPNADHLALLLELKGTEVTDFGGAAGEMARALAAHGIRVTVVENPTMVRLGRRSPGVEFATDIPSTCDVFFSSGTIQYIKDPLPILDRAFVSAKQAVVLVRNAFSDKPIASVQESWLSDNGGGPTKVPGFKDVRISYPHWTVRESDVFAAAELHGFRCTLKQDEDKKDGAFPKAAYGRRLVFKRHDAPTTVM